MFGITLLVFMRSATNVLRSVIVLLLALDQQNSHGATDTETENVCPAGRYCEAGVGNPSLCPVGTYSRSEGITTVDVSGRGTGIRSRTKLTHSYLPFGPTKKEQECSMGRVS